MPNKLTDAEVKKALEWTADKIRGAERIIVYEKDIKKLYNNLMNALDLINRQTTRLRKVEHQLDDALKMGEIINAENVSLKAENSNLTSDLSSLQKDLTSAKAEAERLKEFATSKCADCAGCTSWKCDCANIEAQAKAEAYKEFAELVHCHCESIINQEWNKKVSPVSWADAYKELDNEVDNLLNELIKKR